jgi:hypothetical protein
MVILEKLVEGRLAWDTEVLEDNLPQRHFVRHKSHMTSSGLNPGRRGGKPATKRLSYGAYSWLNFINIPAFSWSERRKP